MNLFVMAVTLSTAALLLGIGADRLRTRGIQTQTILGYAALLFVAAESLLILDVRSVSPIRITINNRNILTFDIASFS